MDWCLIGRPNQFSKSEPPKAPRPIRTNKNQENQEKQTTSKNQEIIIWKQGIQEITVHGLRVTVQVTVLDSDSGRSVQANIMKTRKSMKTQAKSRK